MNERQINLKKYGEGIPMPNVVKFSHNWNEKLNGKFFTTIRKPENYSYYEPRIGEIFEVLLDGKPICSALLKDATLTSLSKITPELMVLDTGNMNYKLLFERFGIQDNCVLLLFEKVK